MAITTDQIKQLRDATGVSVMQCKNALEEAGGDMDKAKIILQKLSAKAASKKADRTLGSGTVASYIHGGGAVGAMVEVQCETDFVARNEDFQSFARDVAMHVAASVPEFLSVDDINEDAKSKAKEVFEKEAEGKPDNIREQVIDGKLKAYFKEKTLLEQDFIKDPSKTISDLVQEAIQKFGEKIEITRMARFGVLE
ncbi:elongation factor Ts [Candidatus Nomurabacteria bacterium]|nr:elongation factor Ts [Candidatus Nomurabacteria bacterium]